MNCHNFLKIYSWEIDHIKPCASFNMSKPKEQKNAFTTQIYNHCGWKKTGTNKENYNVIIWGN